MTKIKFEIIDYDYKVIETHKWDTEDWDKVEKTISYLRRKYGKVRTTPPPNNNSWVQE